jgi:hypothetical protein
MIDVDTPAIPRYCQERMETLPPEPPSEEAIESEANRKLAKRLAGARIRLIGTSSTNFRDYPAKECPVCNRGERQKAFDATREHAVCLSCGRATKYLQNSINAVLKDMNQQLKFWRNFRLAQIKFKRKGVGKGNRGADPGRGAKSAHQALIDRFK